MKCKMGQVSRVICQVGYCKEAFPKIFCTPSDNNFTQRVLQQRHFTKNAPLFKDFSFYNMQQKKKLFHFDDPLKPVLITVCLFAFTKEILKRNFTFSSMHLPS